MASPTQQGEVCEVRPVRQRDIRYLVDLVLAYIDFYGRPRPERRQVRWLVEQVLRHPNWGRQFVAYVDGRMVGFATLYYTFSTLRTGHIAVLNDLFVLSEYRRIGVGARLFETCLALVREKGFAHMEWVTAPDNYVARSFYEKLGAERQDWVQYAL